MILLLQMNYGLGVIIAIGVMLSVGTALATWLIARSIYKTTMPTRLADTFKGNYEAEKIRADQAERERDALREAAKTWEAEKASLTLDYTQLSQLFAKKSLILEAMTGYYGNLANVSESGRLKEYLDATLHPVKHSLEETVDNPHITNNPHITKS